MNEFDIILRELRNLRTQEETAYNRAEASGFLHSAEYHKTRVESYDIVIQAVTDASRFAAQS